MVNGLVSKQFGLDTLEPNQTKPNQTGFKPVRFGHSRTEPNQTKPLPIHFKWHRQRPRAKHAMRGQDGHNKASGIRSCLSGTGETREMADGPAGHDIHPIIPYSLRKEAYPIPIPIPSHHPKELEASNIYTYIQYWKPSKCMYIHTYTLKHTKFQT